jgi:DNA-binding beta-propeller fold protein YncE
VLTAVASIPLPAHTSGGFDHGDVHLASGQVFVAHTANGTVEVIDGERAVHRATLGPCPEASGVVCAQDAGLVFAAARGAGTVLIIEAAAPRVVASVGVGPRPNGLAWAPRRQQLLVAGVEDHHARLVDPRERRVVASAALPGRPRWCAYDPPRDRFLVNIRAPACVVGLAAATLAPRGTWEIRGIGPHGLDLDPDRDRAFVACDGGTVVAADLATGQERGAVDIAGEPDVVWYNRGLDRLYVAIGQPGVLDVVDGRAMALCARLPTEAGAHTTAFDSQRQLLYVFLPRSGRAAAYRDDPDNAT